MYKYSLAVIAIVISLVVVGCSSVKSANTAPVGTTGTAAKTTTKALPRLLDLGATSCIPCKMMAKVLDELKKDYKGKLKVDFIDVKKDTAAVEKYNVKVIPLQIFYDAKGKELFRHVGYFSKADIVKKFKALGIDLNK